MLKSILVSVAVFLLAQSPALAKKKPVMDTQTAMFAGCVNVYSIHSRRQSFLAGPGLDATVHNTCGVVQQVSVTIAYYNASGQQFGTGYELGTVAAGAEWRIYHSPIMDRDRLFLRECRIVKVEAF